MEGEQGLSRKQIAIQLALILALIYIPPLYAALRVHLGFTHYSRSLASQMENAFQYLVKAGLILYLIRFGKESFSKFGITKPKPSDIYWGLLLMFALTVILAIFLKVLSLMGDKAPFAGGSSSTGVLPFWAAIIYSFSLALYEEVLWRSYVFTRLKELGCNSAIAVFASAALFASWRINESWTYMVVIFVIGLIFGFVFVKYKRIAPLVVAMFTISLIGFMVAASRAGSH